jgi:hypothetical protein
LIDKISNESTISKRYKEIIDKLNPKILQGINSDRKLARLISIDENKKAEIKSLQKFIDLIDDQRLSNINVEITE